MPNPIRFLLCNVTCYTGEFFGSYFFISAPLRYHRKYNGSTWITDLEPGWLSIATKLRTGWLAIRVLYLGGAEICVLFLHNAQSPGHIWPPSRWAPLFFPLGVKRLDVEVYGSNDSTKSPASGIPTVSEPKLMSQVGECAKLCARRSVCCCSLSGGGASILAGRDTSVPRTRIECRQSLPGYQMICAAYPM